MRTAILFVAFQMTWWGLVLSSALEQKTGVAGLSLGLSLLVAAGALAHLLSLRRREATFAAVLAVVGFLLDSLWMNLGWLESPSPLLAEPVVVGPAWLLALWLAFTAFSFATLKSWRLPLAVTAPVGAVAGVLSYKVGEPLGVLSFPPDRQMFALIALALEWAVAFPLIVWLVRLSNLKR